MGLLLHGFLAPRSSGCALPLGSPWALHTALRRTNRPPTRRNRNTTPKCESPYQEVARKPQWSRPLRMVAHMVTAICMMLMLVNKKLPTPYPISISAALFAASLRDRAILQGLGAHILQPPKKVASSEACQSVTGGCRFTGPDGIEHRPAVGP